MAGLALVWDLIARDGASPTFARVAASADRAATSTAAASGGVAGFSKKALGALGALATIDFAGHLVSDAARFERSMLLIQTQAGASAGEVKRMSGALLGLATSVGTGPEKLATSLYHVESVGLRGAAALEAVKIAAEGAKVGNADLEQTTNALTSAVASGIDGVQSMSQAMGALNATVGAGDMNLEQLNEALGTGILTKAKTFGLSLRDVGAALATLGDLNIRGADAATQLRMAFEALAKQGGPGQKALKGIGIEVNQLRKDMISGGLNKALVDLNTHLQTAGITGKQVGSFLLDAFSKKGASGVTLLLTNLDRFHVKMDQIGKGAGTFGDQWSATTKTTAFAFDQLRAGLESAAIVAGQKLTPAVTGAVHFLTGDLGPALVGPWHDLEGVLSIVGDVFGAIGRVVGALHLPVAQIGIAALGAVLGFKAFSAVPALFEALTLRLKSAAIAVIGFGETVAAGAVTAEVSWTAMLGPIGAAAIGVGLLISMFHSSSSASKEAANSAKTFADVLKSGSRSELVDSITTQLAKANVPEQLATIQKALGSTAISGRDFVSAIESGGKPLDDLRAQLKGIIKDGTSVTAARGGVRGMVEQLTPAAYAARDALGHLNAQIDGLSKATKKDLIDTRTFVGVSSSIDKVSQTTQVASKTAQAYAQMVGIQVDKNGVAAVSADTLSRAVSGVSTAYNNATQTSGAMLDALQTFSGSAATAADRAALIGSTLKAANGDALNYAKALTGTTDAVHGLVDSFTQQADQLKQQSADQAKAMQGVSAAHNGQIASSARLAAAQARLDAVRGKSKSTAAQIASAEAAVKSAQASSAASADRLGAAQTAAGKAGALAYADTERAALRFKGVGDKMRATIDTNAKGAGSLVQQLQGIQDAAMGAATAMFQHEKGTKGASKAADDAYSIYVSKTQGELVDQAAKLGITKDQAKALGKQYFGMPKSVKTLIKAEGVDPILTVLDRIGRLLANITGQEWDVKVKLHLPTTGMTPAQRAAFNLANAGANANGTKNWRGGWTKLNEFGPESVKMPAGYGWLPPGTQVIPAGETARNQASRVVTVNQTFTSTAYEKPSALGPAAVREAARRARWV